MGVSCQRASEARRQALRLRSLGSASAAALLAAFGATCPASAQALSSSAAASQAGVTSLDEIVVTAQKRNERLQDVPFAVSAISGAAAEADGARGFDTLEGKVAGLQILGIGEEALQFSVRGVITDRQGRTPQTAALYWDEIPVGIAGDNPNFQQIDVDRVEILRGPQGTLFGAGAESGAVRIIPAKPDLNTFAWGGGAEASDTTHGGANGLVYGVANMPLIDGQLAVRAVAYERDWSGYIDNIALGVKGANSETIGGGRLTVLYAPNDRLSLNLMAQYQDFRGPDTDWDNSSLPHWEQEDTVRQNIESKNGVFALTANYKLDFAQLTSVTSYQDTDSFLNDDATRYVVLLGAAPGQFPKATLPSYFFQRGFSQEFRIASPDSSHLKWIAGVFYSDTDYGVHQTFPVPGFEAAVPGDPPAASFGLPKDDLGNFLQTFHTKQISLFGDATVPVTTALSLSAGLRYYHYDQDGLIDYNGLLEGEDDRLVGHPQASGVNPRFNASYQLDHDKLLYVQISRGFRIGGLSDPAPQAFCGGDLAAIGLSSAPAGYGPDHLWNYEGGLKSSWDNQRVTLDASAFYIDWTNIQSTKRLSCGYAIVVNGGDVTSKGLELEGSANLLPGLTVSGSATYTDSQISRLPPDGTFGTSTGQYAPYTPKWAYDIAINYSRSIAQDIDGFGTVEYSYTGQRYTDFNPATAYNMPAFGVVSAKLGLKHGPWAAFLFGDNLGNRYGILDLTSRGAAYPTYISASTIRPRTVGLRFTRAVQ
jgi:iron complex outermembrane recepter protein